MRRLTKLSGFPNRRSSLLGTVQQVAGAFGTALVVMVMSAHAATLTRRGTSPQLANLAGMRLSFAISAAVALVVLVLCWFDLGEEPVGGESLHQAGDDLGRLVETDLGAPRLERARSAQILTEPATRRHEQCVAKVLRAFRFRVTGEPVDHLLVLVDRPGALQPLARRNADLLLTQRVEVVDLDRQFSTEIVEQRACDPTALLDRGRNQHPVQPTPGRLISNQVVER